MCRARWVLVLAVMCVGVAHSWDITVSVKDQLIFYTNGTKTKTVDLISQNPAALVYDEVHNVMLYVDKQNSNDAVCGYYLSSKDNKCFIKRNGRDIHGLAFDPVTELIFFTDTNEKSINFISLKPGSNNYIYGNLLIRLDEGTPADIVVDSCRGYIYWSKTITPITNGRWERAQFNGSKREIMKEGNTYYYVAFSLAIDPQKQKLFYFDICQTCSVWVGYLNSNNLNGSNELILASKFYEPRSLSKKLTISKDYIYWSNSSERYDSVWQLPKNTGNYVQPKEINKLYDERILGITARYPMEDQIKGIQDCDSLSRLSPTISVIPDHTDEGRGYDVCENYCFQGNCSINEEGLPKCSCNASYSGRRCEVDACQGYCLNNGDCSLNENNEPVCQCEGDYSGDRCESSGCLNYCLQGNCSLSNDGHHTCSCNAGYSGDRCDVSVCHDYCLNDGECSLNEEDQPVCQCVGNYEGLRCEVNINDTTPPTYDSVRRNLTVADLLSKWRKPASKMFVVVEV